MLNLLKILKTDAIFTLEASMKDQFSKKGVEPEGDDADSGIMISRIGKESDPYRESSQHQLKEMIGKNRKFFRISAELSINSN